MILSILKIIGMIILVLLAIILLILLEVLFVPVRYEMKGYYLEKADADVKVTWFPVFLKVIASFHEGKLIYIVKAFGGVIMTNTDARISYLGRKLFSEADTNAVPEAENHNGFSSDDEVDKPVYSDESKDSETAKIDLQDTSESNRLTSKRKSSGKKRKSFIKRLKQKINAFFIKIKMFVESLKKLFDKKDDLLKVYHSKRFEKAKNDVILYVKKLIHILKPDKLNGHVHLGLKDPAATGEIFGLLAMFLPLYDGRFELVPEFEYACNEIDVYTKGKFRIFPILVLGIRIIFNKNLIKVTKKVQTIIER